MENKGRISDKDLAKMIVSQIEVLDGSREYDKYFKEITKFRDFQDDIELSKYQKKIGFRVIEEIYSGIDPNEKNKVIKAETLIRKFLKLYKPTKHEWEKTIERSVKNLLFTGKGNFEFYIDNFYAFRNIVKSWQSLGLGIYFSNIEKYAIEEIGKFNDNNRLSQSQQRIANIFDNYAKTPELRQWIMKVRNPNLSNLEMKEEIKRIDKQNRIIYNGKHLRHPNLARYLKILHSYTCARCNKDSSTTEIEASHNIPLSLGVKMGGVDRSWNISVLCSECHKFEEMMFFKKYNKLETVESKLNWITTEKGGRPEKSNLTLEGINY